MPKRLQRRPLAAAIFMMFAAPSLALAQAQPETTLPEIKVRDTAGSDDMRTESTRGATRTDTPLRDIPQFINIVPQAVIKSQNAATLQDALRNVPGISYAAPEGGTQVNQVFFLRGFPIFGDIFIDGVRDLGEYNRDLFATDSVEVLKGPSALMFGRGSTGGLINQVTKVADQVERKDVAVTFGSYQQRRATADVDLVINDTSAFRLAAVGEDSGSYRYPQGVKKYGFAPSFWTKIGDSTDLTLSSPRASALSTPMAGRSPRRRR
jgi:catecholate siderophore receptor